MPRIRTMHHAARHRVVRAGAAVLLALLVGLVVPAADAQLATRWDDGLDKVERSLEAGEWAAAEKRAEKLLVKIASEVGSYERPGWSLARTLGLLAVAEEGVGERHDALWHWAMARTLDRRAERMDVSRFGAPGRFLAEVSRRRVQQVPGDWDDLPVDPLAVPQPIDPWLRSEIAGALDYDRERPPQEVEIEVLVDSAGRPHAPVLVVPTRFPGFAVAVMESMRAWRFEPAERGAETVSALAVVTVPFPEGRWRSRAFTTARIPCSGVTTRGH